MYLFSLFKVIEALDYTLLAKQLLDLLQYANILQHLTTSTYLTGQAICLPIWISKLKND